MSAKEVLGLLVFWSVPASLLLGWLALGIAAMRYHWAATSLLWWLTTIAGTLTVLAFNSSTGSCDWIFGSDSPTCAARERDAELGSIVAIIGVLLTLAAFIYESNRPRRPERTLFRGGPR